MKRSPNLKMKSVFVALSGGVDSAVSALLLKQAGYIVTGVFMKNWSGEEFGISNDCPWKRDQRDAASVCKHLNIPFKTYNFEKEYREEVITYFFDSYRRGETPNPDILCNQHIKFGHFLDKAMAEGADMIATGHYAQIGEGTDSHPFLQRAADSNKDQTYFLYRLTKEQLSRTLFPIGHLTKSKVRKIAEKQRLPVAKKKDSQGICFVGKVNLREFLSQELLEKKGKIIDIDTGHEVGTHSGAWFYTNGQREGLRIGGSIKPYFVAGKNVGDNIVYVAKGKDNPHLYSRTLSLRDAHWINNPSANSTSLIGIVRYRQIPVPCIIHENIIIFDAPVWKPTIGQSVVLFNENEVLGGGIIDKIEDQTGK